MIINETSIINSNIMKTLKIIAIFALFLFFNCASTEDVLSDFDDTANFDDYSTFVICIDDLFVENTQYPNYDNNAVRSLIADEVESQMIKRGYKTNVVEPQLQAGFQLILEKKEVTFTNCEIQDEYNYWEKCTINTEVYTEETLVIYVSDFSKNQIIWQASVTCDMNRSKARLPGYVNELVGQLFTEYPIN